MKKMITFFSFFEKKEKKVAKKKKKTLNLLFSFWLSKKKREAEGIGELYIICENEIRKT